MRYSLLLSRWLGNLIFFFLWKAMVIDELEPTKVPKGNFIILLLYEDDMLIVGQDADMIQSLKRLVQIIWQCKADLRHKHFSWHKSWKIVAITKKYIKLSLERFNIKHAKPICTWVVTHFKLSNKACLTIEKEKEKKVCHLFLTHTL